jgi:hypothetical protein
MTDPQSIYRKKVTDYSEAARRQKQRLRVSSGIRLMVFASAALCGYLAFGGQVLYGLGAAALLALFAYLVARHQDMKYEAARLDALIRINQTELDILGGNFSNLEDGAEFGQPGHAYSDDLDLFGPNSFYQYLNRSGLPPGREMLARWLASNAHDRVEGKQEAIQELSPRVDWRQNFAATAHLIKTPVSGPELVTWFCGYRPVVPSWTRRLPALFTIGSVAAGVLFVLEVLPLGVLAAVFFTGLLISLPFAKRIGVLSQSTGKMQETFRQYRRLVAQVEGETFRSGWLKEAQATFLGVGPPVSAQLRKFSRIIGALEQRNNLIIALFGNAFFLRDIRQARAVEQWIRLHSQKVGAWFEALARFDAINSLANFAFSHPEYVYPEILRDKVVCVRSSQLAHPLLFIPPVCNDFELENGHFMVITGANMAGKSTFLRAVGLSIVMANMGLPVRAERMQYTPIPLISSMRTEDSLSRHESYFFAELRRLKTIVDHLKQGPYFVILDEILKGTNSRDKAQGSQEFLERLLRLKATGLIATHDLSLCEVAGRVPGVHNYFFDAAIRDGALHFDYRLKPGVCSNMNASFLLRKLGVVEDLPQPGNS